MPDDELEDAAAGRSERHADANLGGSLAHGGGQHAVEADHREDGGNAGEHRNQDQREAGGRNGLVNVELPRPDLGEQQSRILLGHCIAHRRGHRVRVAIRAHGPAEGRPPLAVAIHEKHALAAVVHHRGVALVLRHANHFEHLGFVGVDAGQHALSDGVAGREQPRRQQVVDDDDLGVGPIVFFAECPARNDWRPREREITGLHEVGDCLLKQRGIGRSSQRAVAREGVGAIEGERSRRRGIHHSRQRLQALERGPLERPAGLGALCAVVLDDERQHAARIEAGVGVLQGHERADHQARANQQHERQSNLGNHRSVAQPSSAATADQAAARPQHIHHVRTRRPPGRRDAEDQRCGKRRRGREGEHRTIERHGGGPRQGVRRQLDQRINAELRQPQAGDAAEEGQHQAFGDQLPDQAPAAAADRGAHRQLALARGRSHQQQVGDVGAGDQQHEHDRAHQRHQLRPHIGHQVGMHRLDAEIRVGGLLDGKARAQVGRQPVEFRLGLIKGDTRLQPGNHAQEHVVTRSRLVVHAVGDHDVGARLDVGAGRKQQFEPRRQHADDVGAAIAEFNAPADDRRITAVAALPELVAEDRDGRQRRRSLVGGNWRTAGGRGWCRRLRGAFVFH